MYLGRYVGKVGRYLGMFLYYYYYMYFFLLLLLLSTASSSSSSSTSTRSVNRSTPSTYGPQLTRSLSYFPFPNFPISHFFVITVIHTNCLIIQRTAS